MKIALDIGGVLSKYPQTFKPLINLINLYGDKCAVEVWFISDMPLNKIKEMLSLNDIPFLPERVRSADYKRHGEMCKSILCEELGIDMLIDDFPGYIASGKHARLLVMPSPEEPYYHDDWRTNGSEGDFGRRRRT